MNDPRPDRVRNAEDTILDLHAENARLRAALKPFAELGYDGVPNQEWIDTAKRVLDEQSTREA